MRRLEARPSSSSKYLTLEKWKEFYTDKQFDLEHVLPQSTRMSPALGPTNSTGSPPRTVSSISSEISPSFPRALTASFRILAGTSNRAVISAWSIPILSLMYLRTKSMGAQHPSG